jgi:hypothetical protein
VTYSHQLLGAALILQHSIWVTDLCVNKGTVYRIMKGARARWRIENETFNTLKIKAITSSTISATAMLNCHSTPHCWSLVNVSQAVLAQGSRSSRVNIVSRSCRRADLGFGIGIVQSP